MLAFAALDDERLAAYGAEGAHGAVHAANEEFCGAVEDFARAAALAVQGWSCCAHVMGLTIARERPARFATPTGSGPAPARRAQRRLGKPDGVTPRGFCMDVNTKGLREEGFASL